MWWWVNSAGLILIVTPILNSTLFTRHSTFVLQTLVIVVILTWPYNRASCCSSITTRIFGRVGTEMFVPFTLLWTPDLFIVLQERKFHSLLVVLKLLLLQHDSNGNSFNIEKSYLVCNATHCSLFDIRLIPKEVTIHWILCHQECNLIVHHNYPLWYICHKSFKSPNKSNQQECNYVNCCLL